MAEEINHEFTQEIVCPYCGYKFSDSWELNDSSGIVQECHGCEKPFTLEVDFDVTYSTEKNCRCSHTQSLHGFENERYGGKCSKLITSYATDADANSKPIDVPCKCSKFVEVTV